MTNAQDTKSRIAEYRRKPALYRNIDGTEEINIGVMGLFGFLGLWLLPKGYSFPFFVAIITFCYWMPRFVKNRYTYPRTGFVEPQCTKTRKGAVQAISMFVAAAMAAALGISLRHRLTGESLIVPAIGLVGAIGYARGYGKQAPWKQFVAAAVALGGCVTAFLPEPLLPDHRRFIGSLVLYFIFSGAVFLASGLITLTHYIRTTRAAEPAE